MNRTAEMIEENASNSFAEADIKKVLGYIKQTGEKGIKHGDLVKKLWRMSANNRKNAISTLSMFGSGNTTRSDLITH